MVKKYPVAYFVILAFFLFGCSSTLVAQDDYEDGYVVTLKNDTLYGKVSDRKTGAFGGIYEKIRFKGERKKKRFAPKHIKAYKIGETRFKSLFLDGEMTFLKVVSEGYVSHYRYELQEQGEQLVLDIDYIQKNPYQALIRANQGLFGLKKKRLANVFSDCPELVVKIRSKEFKRVAQVVAFYNDWKANL